MVYTHAMSILEGSPLVRVAVQGLDRCMMNGDDFPQDRVLRRLIGLRADFEQLYIDTIAIGIDEGAFSSGTDARLAAKWVLGAVNWMVIWVKPMKRAKRPSTGIASGAADFILRGLGGTPSKEIGRASCRDRGGQ